VGTDPVVPSTVTLASGALIVVDRNAGAETGHHRHWLELLVEDARPDVPLVVLRAGPAADDTERVAGRDVRVVTLQDQPSRTAWYSTALEVALSMSPRAVVLTSGDDAFAAVARRVSLLRRQGVDLRALMFRLSPQPGRLGRTQYAVKLVTVVVAQAVAPSLSMFALELPVGRRRLAPRLLGLGLVTDSSGGEQADGIGHGAARAAAGLASTDGPVVLTIGMLGPGKHVDTLLDAWTRRPLPGGQLVFAGVADVETDALLTEAEQRSDDVSYRPGRLSDDDFSLLVEAADIVTAVYRYSASSGIVLRAAALGSRVLVGGSRALAYSLAGVPGITLVRRPSADRLAEQLAAAMWEPRPVPARYEQRDTEFPRPLLGDLSVSSTGVRTAPAVLILCRKTGALQEAVVSDIEAAFMRAGLSHVGTGQRQQVVDQTARVAGRLGITRRLRRSGPVHVVGMLGPAERQLVPHGLTGRQAWYVWDCWPDNESRWASMFQRWKPEFVFFSCRAAADHWAPKLPHTHVEWSPEAVEVGAYRPGPDLAERRTLLLELGRRHPTFHKRASAILAERGAVHLHSSEERQFVFADRAALIAGLQSTVASVCYPGSVTDPGGRTGIWETMTHRYLEAAATRTLIVGGIPQEMRDLFGFTPGVEVDPDDPDEALSRILDDPGAYQDLVDRTHARLLEVASWDVRVREIRQVIGG
jgi:glycosyltransferase involved in cell wall biosynthesis